MLPIGSEFMSTLGLTTLYLGFGCLLARSVMLPTSNNLLARLTAWIGKHSYSIYLWHIPIRAILNRGQVNFTYFVFGCSVSIIFGAAMSKLIEIPSLKIRDRLFPAFSKKDPQPKLVLQQADSLVTS